MEIRITIQTEGQLANSAATWDGASNSSNLSCYAKYFDETCLGWRHDAEANLMFLRCQQAFANDVLKSKGYLFLNDVYDMLGFPRTKAGQVVGWVYDKDNPVGDNFVDFRVFEWRNKDFVNGHERSVLLDFNVDGCIIDRVIFDSI